MALKNKYEKREEIPAAVATFYVEREGAWLLDTDRDARVDEMRATSVAALKELAEFKARFEGIDPAAVRALETEKARLEEERLFKAGEADKVVERRLKAARLDWEKQFGTVTAERDALNGRLAAIQIDQAVVTEATKRGLRPTALPDIAARARQIFKLVGGMPKAFEADGQTARMGKDGVTPMTLAEWVEVLGTDAPHLFAANAGGGAAGSGPGGTALGVGVKNPFRKESWNLTEQMLLLKKDPSLAARLEATA